jgi:hypothetical protein
VRQGYRRFDVPRPARLDDQSAPARSLSATSADLGLADVADSGTLSDMGVHQVLAAGRLPHRAARLLAAALVAAPLAVAVQPSAASTAGPTLTFDKAAFLSSHRIVSTETFDEFATPTEYPPRQRRVVIDSVRFRSVDPAPPSWAIDAGVASPDNALLRRFNSGSGPLGSLQLAIAFRDGGSSPALGFLLQPVATTSQFELVVTEANGDATSYVLPRDIGDTYIGVSSPNGVTRVLIRQHLETGVGLTNFAVNDVSRGRIAPAR